MTYNVDPDYVDVAERIRLFYERYPEGRLTTTAPELLHVGERTFVYVQARAYRTADDETPCWGTAWEPIPGPTPFTRDSELQNAETAAWGRAIVAAGIPSKKIASADEVQARRADGNVAPSAPKPASKKQVGEIHRVEEELVKLGVPTGPANEATWEEFRKAYMRATWGKDTSTELTSVEASALISWMNEHRKVWEEQEAIPF